MLYLTNKLAIKWKIAQTSFITSFQEKKGLKKE